MSDKVGLVGNVGQFQSFFLIAIYMEKSLKLPHDPLLPHSSMPGRTEPMCRLAACPELAPEVPGGRDRNPSSC